MIARARRARELVGELRTLFRPEVRAVILKGYDRRFVTSPSDDVVPLPPGARAALTTENPRLRQLRDRYAALDLPVLSQSRWHRDHLAALDLLHFRGDTAYVWHYRELPRVTALRYYLHMRYVQERDPRGLLGELGEDGAFGCWTWTYPDHPTVSRDLLDSVNEICFLERALALSSRDSFSVLDIGAGYGRFAHRMTAAYPNLRDHCCVDAVPESTFLSEYYLGHRGCLPQARVVPLDEVGEKLEPGSFDLAVAIHSLPETPLSAIRWWFDQLQRLEVPHLLLVPNEREGLFSTERDHRRVDARPLLGTAGYRLVHEEPVFDDPAVRELLTIDDVFQLYSR